MSIEEPNTQAERLAAARQHHLYVKGIGRSYTPGMRHVPDWSGLATVQQHRAVMVAEEWVAHARSAGLIPYTTVVVMPDQVAALQSFLGARVREAQQAAPIGAAREGTQALATMVYRTLGRLQGMIESDPLQAEIQSLWKMLADLAEGFEGHPDFKPHTWTPKGVDSHGS